MRRSTMLGRFGHALMCVKFDSTLYTCKPSGIYAAMDKSPIMYHVFGGTPCPLCGLAKAHKYPFEDCGYPVCDCHARTYPVPMSLPERMMQVLDVVKLVEHNCENKVKMTCAELGLVQKFPFSCFPFLERIVFDEEQITQSDNDSLVFIKKSKPACDIVHIRSEKVELVNKKITRRDELILHTLSRYMSTAVRTGKFIPIDQKFLLSDPVQKLCQLTMKRSFDIEKYVAKRCLEIAGIDNGLAATKPIILFNACEYIGDYRRRVCIKRMRPDPTTDTDEADRSENRTDNTDNTQVSFRWRVATLDESIGKKIRWDE